jgi:benzoylformate decarboxylase
MHDYLPIKERNGFYTCASGGLGHGLPAAVGVALGRPGERVIALLGDGSAMYAIQGLWSAAQLKLPITFIIFKNGGYHALDAFASHFGLPAAVGTKMPGIDFCALARAQGLEALHVEAPDGLDQALQRAFQSAGPILVEVELVESV